MQYRRNKWLPGTQQSGYSLLELLIYIALFAVISVLLVRSLITVMKTYATAQAFRRLQSNGELVMERIVREVRASHTVANVTAGANPGSLSVIQGDEDTTVTFAVDNGAVEITSEGESGALTSGQVITTALVFYPFTTASGTGIKTELTLTTTTPPIVSASFYSTTVVRNHH